MGKRILVLSDNEGLARAIELNLVRRQSVDVVRLPVGTPALTPSGAAVAGPALTGSDFDLIVVAISSPANEPVVALARAALTECIGRVPILIISDKPFSADVDVRISHLDFPFAIDKLNDRVREILWWRTPASSEEGL